MPKHVVRPGECLTTIARQYGFLDYRTVYEHPDNEALRQKRPNPNILFPGDVVAIPERKAKSVSVSTGQVHRFQIVVPKKELSLQLQDHKGEPLANEPYVLEVDGEPPTEGKQTDGDGKLKERVPLARAGATLTIRGRTMRLRFGALNPLRDCPKDDVSGLQGRLRNLGYNPGPADGILGPQTRAALAVFQVDEGLDMTGEPDEQTLGKLEERYGC
ncbi:MAG: peptidoglycan-binding protein [Myxococcaceae bacterium]|nr:peptidoglycan-binding protein [Myxococcaceae bacterium]